MKTFQESRKLIITTIKALLVYGLPFAYFYAIADVIEILKHPSVAYHTQNSWEVWLAQNNHDNVMQYLILLVILSGWAISFHLFQTKFRSNQPK